MTISDEERQVIIGALDSMAVLLCGYSHEWSEGERVIYEEACAILGIESKPDGELQGPDDDREGEGWKGK